MSSWKKSTKKKTVQFLKEFTIKNTLDFNANLLKEHFPLKYNELTNILKGKIIFRNIVHIWSINEYKWKIQWTNKLFQKNIYKIIYFKADQISNDLFLN